MAQSFRDYVERRLSPETLARIDLEVAETVRALRLADLRKAMELTQKDMAAALNVGQPTISKIERDADMMVSTLDRYIQAMGGRLRVIADFGPDAQVEIANFEALGENSNDRESNAHLPRTDQ